MKHLVSLGQRLLPTGVLPDFLIRLGIRLTLAVKGKEAQVLGLEKVQERFMAFVAACTEGPIAVDTCAANEQHYEVPTEFYKLALGKHLKYSSAYYRPGVTSLDEAEGDMLAMTCERAQLADGQHILEFGCGWGSLTLFMAARYPKAMITAVSNSRTQKMYIDAEARSRGLENIEVVTADMNIFEPKSQGYDRLVSVEMFEHMRNYKALLAKVGRALKPGGKCFVHISTHRDDAYYYEHDNEDDWIGKYFFTGGIMPSDHFMLYFQDELRIERHWRVSGTHYQKTAEGWLQNMDKNKAAVETIFRKTYGKDWRKWVVYWRVFFMACAEMWGYEHGREWFVSHYLFERR
jgi:cyclopropane-fatty-acyl-phospholipid synthase